jgi:hypothetical protein
MATWTNEELEGIGNAEELEIASIGLDDKLGKPTTIWVVRVGDDLFVRPVNGRNGAWFRGTQARGAGRIEAGGLKKDVSFVDERDAGINEQVDATYRTKYRRYAANIVNTVLTPKAREATLKLVPQRAA